MTPPGFITCLLVYFVYLFTIHSVNNGKCPSEMMCIHCARSPSVKIAASATTVEPALSRIILIP